MARSLAFPAARARRRAVASPEHLERLFKVPVHDRATLVELERELTDNLHAFLTQSKVAGEIPLGRLVAGFRDTAIPDEPRFVADHVDYLLKEVIPYSVHTGSPRFIGHMTSALPYFLISLSKCMVALHQNTVKIETSRSFTLLERQTLGQLHRLFYRRGPEFYREHLHHRTSTLGLLLSGGTACNITALWVARNAFLDKALGAARRQQGLGECLRQLGARGLAVFASERAHYSLRKGADLLGIGLAGFKVVPVTRHHKIAPSLLVSAMREARAAGLLPFAVVGVAGTTETGHVDPLDLIADLASEEQLHFHVDASWGGPLIFSRRHRRLLAGIERADSLSLDGHKQLYLPMGVGALLFKDPAAARAIEQEAQYVIRAGSFDLGKRSLEGSRPGMALLVHAALHVFGRKGYELLMDGNLARARAFADMIRRHPRFELVSAPELNLLTYRYHPRPGMPASPSLLKELDALNTALQKDQRERGRSFVSRTRLRHPEPKGPTITVLRAVLANPLTQRRDLVEILAEQERIAEDILRRHPEHYRELLRLLKGKIR